MPNSNVLDPEVVNKYKGVIREYEKVLSECNKENQKLSGKEKEDNDAILLELTESVRNIRARLEYNKKSESNSNGRKFPQGPVKVNELSEARKDTSQQDQTTSGAESQAQTGAKSQEGGATKAASNSKIGPANGDAAGNTEQGKATDEALKELVKQINSIKSKDSEDGTIEIKSEGEKAEDVLKEIEKELKKLVAAKKAKGKTLQIGNKKDIMNQLGILKTSNASLEKQIERIEEAINTLDESTAEQRKSAGTRALPKVSADILMDFVQVLNEIKDTNGESIIKAKINPKAKGTVNARLQILEPMIKDALKDLKGKTIRNSNSVIEKLKELEENLGAQNEEIKGLLNETIQIIEEAVSTASQAMPEAGAGEPAAPPPPSITKEELEEFIERVKKALGEECLLEFDGERNIKEDMDKILTLNPSSDKKGNFVEVLEKYKQEFAYDGELLKRIEAKIEELKRDAVKGKKEETEEEKGEEREGKKEEAEEKKAVEVENESEKVLFSILIDQRVADRFKESNLGRINKDLEEVLSQVCNEFSGKNKVSNMSIGELVGFINEQGLNLAFVEGDEKVKVDDLKIKIKDVLDLLNEVRKILGQGIEDNDKVNIITGKDLLNQEIAPFVESINKAIEVLKEKIKAMEAELEKKVEEFTESVNKLGEKLGADSNSDQGNGSQN